MTQLAFPMSGAQTGRANVQGARSGTAACAADSQSVMFSALLAGLGLSAAPGQESAQTQDGASACGADPAQDEREDKTQTEDETASTMYPLLFAGMLSMPVHDEPVLDSVQANGSDSGKQTETGISGVRTQEGQYGGAAAAGIPRPAKDGGGVLVREADGMPVQHTRGADSPLPDMDAASVQAHEAPQMQAKQAAPKGQTVQLVYDKPQRLPQDAGVDSLPAPKPKLQQAAGAPDTQVKAAASGGEETRLAAQQTDIGQPRTVRDAPDMAAVQGTVQNDSVKNRDIRAAERSDSSQQNSGPLSQGTDMPVRRVQAASAAQGKQGQDAQGMDGGAMQEASRYQTLHAAYAARDGEEAQKTQALRSPAGQLADAVRENLGAGKKSFTLRLRPEGLGEVTVSLSMKRETLEMSIRSVGTARELISAGLEELRTELAAGGYQVGELHVGTQTQTDAQPGGGASAWQEAQQASGNHKAEAAAAQEDTASLVRGLLFRSGMINYRV